MREELPPYTVRRATTADAPAMVRCYESCWLRDYRSVLSPAALRAATAETEARQARMARALADGTVRAYVALDEQGQPVGFVSFGPARGLGAPGRGEIYALYVSGSWRGRGVGRTLWRLAVRELRQLGYRVAEVRVLDGAPALAFYRKQGAECVGEGVLVLGGERHRQLVLRVFLPAAGGEGDGEEGGDDGARPR